MLVKEPVKIRKKPLANGGYSLYLDIYRDGKRSFEFLKLYLNPGNDPITKAKNRSAMEAAKVIQAKRLVEVQCETAGIAQSPKALTMDDLLEVTLKEKTHVTPERREMLRHAVFLFNRYAPGIKLTDIDGDTMRGFITYLETAGCVSYIKRLEGEYTPFAGGTTRTSISLEKRNTILDMHEQGYSTEEIIKAVGKTNKFCVESLIERSKAVPKPRYLAPSSVKLYFSTINTMLNKAVKKGYIMKNPVTTLDSGEKPKAQDRIREYLTIEELDKLKKTPCKDDTTRSMFLFGCFTGLRLSDILRVTWRDIDHGTIGMRMQKTDNAIYVPLSENAKSVLPKRGKAAADDLVYAQPPTKPVINSIIHKWVQDAGITKHISFHCSRHTFATLLLYYGVDLYTVSKLLGHTSIAMTQVYAKVMDQKKIEAVNIIPRL